MGIDRKKRSKGKGDYPPGAFWLLPHDVLYHENWIRLSPHGCKLMLDFGRQLKGHNNGYLNAAWEMMQRYGWRSRETLSVALAEVQHYGLIELTRRGGYKRPHLYALTWWRVESRADDPLDDMRPVQPPSGLWKEKRDRFEPPDWVKAKRSRDRSRETTKRESDTVEP